MTLASKPNKPDKTEVFETMPIEKAVLRMAIPTTLSSIVMVLYNLADTYFVSNLNDPIQSAAVTLAAPVLLAFNAVINLFGVYILNKLVPLYGMAYSQLCAEVVLAAAAIIVLWRLFVRLDEKND